MARPRRLLLTAKQVQAIHDRGKRHSFTEIGRDLKLSSETVAVWFRSGHFVRQCSDLFESSNGAALYPPDCELMRRYEEVNLLVPHNQEFSLHADEWHIRLTQVEAVYGAIPDISLLRSLQRVAYLNLIVIEALNGEYVTTAIWKHRHKFVDSEEGEVERTEKSKFVPVDRHWHRV